LHQQWRNEFAPKKMRTVINFVIRDRVTIRGPKKVREAFRDQQPIRLRSFWRGRSAISAASAPNRVHGVVLRHCAGTAAANIPINNERT
jgi:hypothetical protein